MTLSFQYRSYRWAPGTIFGICALISGLLTLFLPETLGRDLPTSVEEVSSWPITISKEERSVLEASKAKRLQEYKDSIEMTGDVSNYSNKPKANAMHSGKVKAACVNGTGVQNEAIPEEPRVSEMTNLVQDANANRNEVTEQTSQEEGPSEQTRGGDATEHQSKMSTSL